MYTVVQCGVITVNLDTKCHSHSGSVRHYCSAVIEVWIQRAKFSCLGKLLVMKLNFLWSNQIGFHSESAFGLLLEEVLFSKIRSRPFYLVPFSGSIGSSGQSTLVSSQWKLCFHERHLNNHADISRIWLLPRGRERLFNCAVVCCCQLATDWRGDIAFSWRSDVGLEGYIHMPFPSCIVKNVPLPLFPSVVWLKSLNLWGNSFNRTLLD